MNHTRTAVVHKAEHQGTRRPAWAVSLTCCAALVGGGLSACGGSSTPEPGSSAPGGGITTAAGKGGTIPENTKDPKIAALVPESVRKRGYITVASENYPTAVIVPEGGGAPTGWEPAIAKQLSTLLGVEFRIKIVPFDSIIPGLQAKRFDIAMGQIAINPERRKVVIFVSEADSSDSFMVKKGSGLNIQKTSDMCGHKVAVLSGSVEAGAVRAANKECKKSGDKPITIQQYNDQSAANLAVQSSRAEINVGSTSTLTYVTQQHPDQFELQGSFKRSDGNITGIAITRTPEGKQLSKALHAGMNKLIKNGTMKAIMNKWNGGTGLIPESKLYP